MNKQLTRRPLRFVGRYIKKRKHMIKQLPRRPMLFVNHYLSELSYYLSEKTIQRLKTVGQVLGIILLTAIFAFISLGNMAPLGITTQYAMGQNTTDISQFVPTNRVQTITLKGNKITKITDDLIYFTTAMPFNFDSATVKIWYQNANPDQTFSIGFQDQSTWHYAFQAMSVPFLDSLNWTRTGENPMLYQRNNTYKSVADFLKNPPKYNIIGTYEYDSFNNGMDQVNLTGYTPQKKETVIPTSFRGSETIYAYLNNEPLHLSFEKQDLNWYPSTDTVTVDVYEGNELVYQVTAPDDGITDASRKLLPAKTVVINNPGPGLPQKGVYKIVINANDDTIIKNIQTNLHKIVFSGSLFLAGNNNAYHGIVASTSATTLYTNALSLSAITYHLTGEQKITVGNQILPISQLQTTQTITPQENLTKVFVPQNDIVLTGFEGYFAFSPDQFFLPTMYYVLPVTDSKSAAMTDYILTNYSPSQQENGWRVNEQTFNLKTAHINQGTLSWAIQAPLLKENHNTILIKNIQITFHKNAWL